MIKKVNIVKLGGVNVVKEFSVKKNKLFMLHLLKVYRLLVIMRMFNVRSRLSSSKFKNKLIKYRNDLRFLNFNGLVICLKYLKKNKVIKGFKNLVKSLVNLITIVKKQEIILNKKYRIYIYNEVLEDRNIIDKIIERNKQKRIRIETKEEREQAKLALRKNLGVVGRHLLSQKPLKDNIKNLKAILLKRFQYLDQRRGSVYKKKLLYQWFLNLKTNKYIIRKLLFSLVYIRKNLYLNPVQILVKRWGFKNKKFEKLVEFWLKNRNGKHKHKNFKFIFKDLMKKRRKIYYLNFLKLKKFKGLFKKQRTGILHFKSYHSNYYITLTDLEYNVIFSCSAGSVSTSNNKKTKTSTVVCTPMFLRILVYLKVNKIRNLKFEIKNKFDKYFYNAFNFFRKKNYIIKTISVVTRLPHHFGQRPNKPRRV